MTVTTRTCDRITGADCSLPGFDGRVDVAHTTSRGSLLDTVEQLFDTHIDIALTAPFLWMQAAVGNPRRRGSPGSAITWDQNVPGAHD